MKTFHFFSTLILMLSVLLSACSTAAPSPTPSPANLTPPQYLEGALQWLQTNAMLGKNVDWAALRTEAANLTPDLKTSTDTYPMICQALRELRDGNTWMLVPSLKTPNYGGDYFTLYPDHKIVTWVLPNGAADKAGLQVGDIIQESNGKAPKPYDPDNLWPPCNTEPLDSSLQENLVVLRDGKELAITIKKKMMEYQDPLLQPTGRRIDINTSGIGYVELPMESGGHKSYPGDVQQVIKKLDSSETCGWIIDLRRNPGGDIWSYIAAVGPILGEGELGGFVYLDGKREGWAYNNGDVLWAGNRLGESDFGGPIYKPKQVTPVALLIGPGTLAAAELLVVAFSGRADLRTFGEPTFGLPTLVTHAELSDGSSVFVSGAFSYDRNKITYEGPITPDVPASTEWSQFGSDHDPAVQTAAAWLSTQSTCQP